MNHGCQNRQAPEPGFCPVSAAAAPFRLLRRRPVVWLFLAALLLRAVYVAQSVDNPLFGVPLVDARMYDDWAARMAGGQWLWDQIENYLPIYPFFLAVFKVAFGAGETGAVKLIQCLMGALTVALLALTGARVWRPAAGWIAGALYATYWLAIVYESEKHAETFCVFFQTLALCLLTRIPPRDALSRLSPTSMGSTGRCAGAAPLLAFGAGVSWALAAGARANLLLTLPFIGVWLLWRPGVTWRAVGVRAATFGLGATLIFGPVLARNRFISGAWILRSQAAWTLYCGLNPEFGGLPIPPGVQWENFMREPLRAGLRSRVEIERYWIERAGALWRERPIAVLANLARRAAMWLNAREFSQEFDADAYRRYSWALSLPWPDFGWIGPLGIVGIFIAGRGDRRRALLLVYLAVAAASIAPFQLVNRYRLPCAPLLALFAGAGILQAIAWLEQRRWRALTLAGAGLAALCVLSWPDWWRLTERRIARHDFFIGAHCQDAGAYDRAVAAYRRSMERFSWDADSPYRIGQIRLKQGRQAEAMEMFHEALRREPQFPDAMAALARICLSQGDLEEAGRWTRNSLRLYPNFETALVLMARIAAARRDAPDEVAWYERALEEGASASTAIEFALRLAELGRLPESMDLLRRVYEEPRSRGLDRARAAMVAGALCAQRLGDADQARRWWERVIEMFPNAAPYHNQALYLTARREEGEFLNRAEAEGGKDGREMARDVIRFAQTMSDESASSMAFLPRQWVWGER